MNKWLVKYRKGCVRKLKERIDSFEKKIDYTKKEIEYHSKEEGFFESEFQKRLYERLKIDINAITVTRKTLEILSKKTDKVLEGQFMKICSHPKTNKVEVKSSNELYVETKKLKVSGFNVGNFGISIKHNENLKIRNLEYKVGTNDHWHISNGEPCLGDWATLLEKYFDTGNILLFTDTLIHYLLAPGDEHAYIKRKEWMNYFRKRTKPEAPAQRNPIDIGFTTTATTWGSTETSYIPW